MAVAAAAFLTTGVAACTPATPTNQTPLAVFSPSVSYGPSPLTVTFDATASSDPDGTIVSYNWNFGDFTTGSGSTVTHSFTPGQYIVTLTVTDNGGRTATSTTNIAAQGAPTTAPTGLQKVGSGCCDTYGDFTWNEVAGAESYEVLMDGYFGGGCLTDHSATFTAPTSHGRVQAIGLCLGSQYNVSIRYKANGSWGPWSPTIHITL
jgi:hypothetical protein